MTDDKPYIVGVGASAGGLDAIEKLFNNMPDNPGMAFVVIQHLSPDYKSLMDEILSKHTQLEILQASDGMAVLADKIYLLPPKNNLKIFHNKLYLIPHKAQRTLNLPIDVFFRSLAEDCGEKSIGIILSGTGSDGTRGIRHIKEKGGMVVVQDQNTAQFDGMPRSAIIAGMVDFILPPEEMGITLVKYIKNPLLSNQKVSDKILDDKGPLQKIFELLKRYTGVDFTYYKKSTIIRRIEQRMGINQQSDLEAYLAFLYDSSTEINILYKQLLIGVTRFFRDVEAFEIIRHQVIPKLFRKNQNELRVWIAGCSTGEEAYSLALLLQEYCDKSDTQTDFKIFATDIDKDAIEFASQGVYPESIREDVNDHYIDEYFNNSGGFYQVARKIREKMVFAPHNLIQNPPFNNMDLIVCRNLLIYLQPLLQKKVFSYFSYSLKKDGFLFLGSSESIGELDSYYKMIDTRWKIYQLINPEIKHGGFASNFSLSRLSSNKFSNSTVFAGQTNTFENDDFTKLQEHLLDDYIKPCIIVDESYNIVMTCGDAKRYLSLPTGRLPINALKLFRRELSVPVGMALHKVKKTGKGVYYAGIGIEMDNGTEYTDLSIGIKKIKDRKYFIISLIRKDLKKSEAMNYNAEQKDFLDDKDQRIKDLEQELQFTKENLQATIEELETSNEELQAANEELLSSNEELQSTNEELQSVNEELITVNAEYQSKIQELTELNNDMDNLLKNTDIGTIFLDMDLCIRKFTPKASEIVNLMGHDIGRPITHISHNLKGENIYDDARKVLQTLNPISAEVQNKIGRTFIKRIRPYITENHQIKGIVITFVDITESKLASNEISKFTYIVDKSPVMISIMDHKGIIEYANPRFYEITGYKPEEVIGRHYAFMNDQTDASQIIYREIGHAIDQGQYYVNEIKSLGRTKAFWEMINFSKIVTDDGSVFIIKISEDITNLRAKRASIEKEHAFLETILENNPNALFFLDISGKITYANAKAEAIMKMPREAITQLQFDADKWEIKDVNNKEIDSSQLPFALVLEKKEPIYNYIHQITDGDGKPVKVRIDARAPIRFG